MNISIDAEIIKLREIASAKLNEKITCGTCRKINKSQTYTKRGYCCHYNSDGTFIEVDLDEEACENYERKGIACIETSEEYTQIADWLSELRDLRSQLSNKGDYRENETV